MTEKLPDEALKELRIAQQPLFPGGPRHPSRKNAYFRALAEAYESGVLAVRVRRATPADDLRVVVTDAMIDAGVEHYGDGGCMGLGYDEKRDVVSDILYAALAQKERAND